MRPRHETNFRYGASPIDAVTDEIRDYHEQRGTEPREAEYGDRWGPLQLPQSWCVYTLRCGGFEDDADFTEHAAWAVGWDNPDIPSWAWAAHYAVQRYYVGFTTNPYRRVSGHVEGDDGALFTRLFPPRSIRSIEWYQNESEARMAESPTADRIDDELTDAFVYQQ